VAGVYISWPFCAQKCTYCNFASGVQPRGTEERYRAALAAEIAGHAWAWVPETLYIGGGTPSGIDADQFEPLLAGLPGSPWREATIEVAPGSFDAGKVEAWRCAGIDRVSLGVQSFDPRELARTGRRHDAAMVERDIATLRAGGIENFNIDLIAGLPGQTEESWRGSVASTLALEAPHVSIYMLEVDDDSRLGAEILLGGKKYGAMDVPSDDAIAGFYEYAVEELARHGIARYEISNFAVPGAESLHNMKYWRREPYVGFGSDAHSFEGGVRRQNAESVEDYLRGLAPEQSESDAVEEKFFVGLRMTEGVTAGEADWQRFGTVFERFLSDGMMEREGERLRLTPRGIMVSNEIFQEFIG
jgi:oxygen-independent coproporphyrinogen-3 oxidase